MQHNRTPLVAVLLAALLVPALAAAQVNPAPVCLFAISKDLCDARLFDGTWGIPFCQQGGENCNNLVGEDATFNGLLASSSGTCGEFESVPCDEAEAFGGILEATVDVRSQRHTACKARGSWDGKFRIVTPASATLLADGDLVGTLGVGTHRPACQSNNCSKDCERCHDARRLANFDWEIGSEGTLKGRVVAGAFAGCSFTMSFQGDFIADGDSRGPQVPDPAWTFCGTLEGVMECPCGTVDPDAAASLF